MRVSLLIVLVFAVLAVTAVVLEPEVHSSGRPPRGWIKAERAQPNHRLRILVALKQRNVHMLEAVAESVSDPRNPAYGNHITFEEANAIVAPYVSDVDRVMEWMRAGGVEDVELSASGDFVHGTVATGHAETLLSVKFHTFKHSSGAKLVRTLDTYSVPADISERIDFIGGITRFPSMMQRARKSTRASNAEVNPAVIKKQYNIPADTVGKAANNTQGVAQFLEQYYAPTDLAKFFKNNNLPADDSKVALVLGPNDPSNPGDEASLDIEYIMGVAVGVPTWFVYTAGRDADQEPFLEWMVAMEARPDCPLVFSVSYGDDENSLSLAYTTRVNTEFAKFASTGRTLLFASGDSGVGCKSCKRFVPAFPAGSPWVTAVGGTELMGQGEVAADFGSGGGFSDYFPQPAYQSQAVATYLATAKKLPAESFFNKSGRAYPDVSALGVSYEVVISGSTFPVDGTSCAAPTFGGVVALLNDVRLQNGKSPLGFLNYWLYQTAGTRGFNDITSGSNGDGCCSGFETAPGWDPVTGFGTPNFQQLKSLMP